MNRIVCAAVLTGALSQMPAMAGTISPGTLGAAIYEIGANSSSANAVAAGTYAAYQTGGTANAAYGSITVSGAPVPLAEVQLNVPGPGDVLSTSGSGYAVVQYQYAVDGLAAGSTTQGTIALNMQTQANSSFGLGAAFAEEQVDSQTFVACSGFVFTPPAGICSGPANMNGTYAVTLQSSGLLTLIVSANTGAGGVAPGTALALADPKLTANDGSIIEFSPGIVNASQSDMPEPASLLLFIGGIALTMGVKRRRRPDWA